MKLTILSGRSGSGKTTALQALEDHGYYCVDNLPLGLLPTLTEQLDTEEHAPERVAVGVDARNLPRQLLAFKSIIKALKNQQVETEVIFLDADPGTLLERFSATRCRIRLRSDVNLSLLIESFGYKNGLPRDADLVFDVRALPNPHWHNELRPLTGRDERIAEFLRGHPESELMLEDIFHFLNRWLPTYAANDRSYVTVAVGCTGGRHRSVYITEQLAHRLRNQGVPLHVRHRELDG